MWPRIARQMSSSAFAETARFAIMINSQRGKKLRANRSAPSPWPAAVNGSSVQGGNIANGAPIARVVPRLRCQITPPRIHCDRVSPSLPPRPSQSLRAAGIGRAALQTLRAETRAAVSGLTSRGIFLATPTARILFLSFETHRGPLTINLGDPLSIDRGATADLSPDRIALRDFAIRVDADTVWQPAPLTQPILPATLQREIAQSLAQEIIAVKGAGGFGGLILPLLDESAPPPDPALSILLRLRESIRNRQWAQAAERAAPLIGLGRGLTLQCDSSPLWAERSFPLSESRNSGRRGRATRWQWPPKVRRRLRRRASTGESRSR